MLIFDNNGVVESAIRRALYEARIEDARIEYIIVTLQIADLTRKLAIVEKNACKRPDTVA